MRRATLTRVETGDEGTFGQLQTDSGFYCLTLELPWRENRRGRSCVPAGTYLFRWRTDSPKHGACYEEWDDPATPRQEDVPDRDHVQIHAANLAGDVDQGYVAELLGCIAPGKAIATFPAGRPPAGAKAQRGVTASKATTRALAKDLGLDLLELTIVWAPGAEPKEAA